MVTEESLKFPIPKMIRDIKWKGSEKVQPKKRFIHRYFSVMMLATDQEENRRRKQLQDEWTEIITVRRKDERLKAKVISDKWEMDIKPIRAKIQRIAPISGTIQVPETVKDNNLFKMAEKKLLSTYTLDGKPYLQFIMSQHPD